MPAVGDAQSLDALDGGGLAGAVRAEDAEDLPLLDGERDAVHGPAALIGLHQILYFDDVLCGGHADRITVRGGVPHRPSRCPGHRPIG